MKPTTFQIATAGGCFTVLFALMGSAAAQAATCPEPPNRVIVQVTAQVAFDPASQLYTYSYTVRNDPASAQEVDRYVMEFVLPKVVNVKSPRGWGDGEYYKEYTFGWDASEVSDPDSIPDDGSVPASIVQIKQGETLSGFSFQSPKPPGSVKYYVTGYAPPSASAPMSELEAEQLVEDCPDLQKPILDLSVIGSTLGPSDAIAVTIDIKPGGEPNSINPRNQGVVPVAILGSVIFDVSRVDQASVRLGLGQAAPRKGHNEDVNRDGYMDLVFQFPTQDIGLRCEDTALFLTGRLRDGKAIAGADSVVTAGCR